MRWRHATHAALAPPADWVCGLPVVAELPGTHSVTQTSTRHMHGRLQPTAHPLIDFDCTQSPPHVWHAGLLPACRAPRSKAAEAALVDEATSLRPGEAQLLLSLLRLLELAADDSGLRENAMEGLAGVLGAALAAHPVAFAARWALAAWEGEPSSSTLQPLDDWGRDVGHQPANA